MPDEYEDTFPMLSERRNIVVIADEVHRTQYGFDAKIKVRKLPLTPVDTACVAINVIATGDGWVTPHRAEFAPTAVSSTDRDTRAVFGDYISIYDMQQASEDQRYFADEPGAA